MDEHIRFIVRLLEGEKMAPLCREFMLGNHQYCYPLTISDYGSRYLISCEGLKSTKSDLAFSIFERAFKDFGLPSAIRTDNGVPFASGNALFGLTRLSVWWLRLGISLQRIKPDYPFHDRAVRVTRCGRICLGRRKINLSIAFAGQTVGVRQDGSPCGRPVVASLLGSNL